jgi:thiol-disulfide isomerase/thioredoxin
MTHAPLQLELYTRPGCHLCDDLRAICERLGEEFPLRLTEVNIDSDPALRARYDLEIPVLWIDGRKAVKYRATEGALRRILQRRLLLRRLFST